MYFLESHLMLKKLLYLNDFYVIILQQLRIKTKKTNLTANKVKITVYGSHININIKQK